MTESNTSSVEETTVSEGEAASSGSEVETTEEESIAETEAESTSEETVTESTSEDIVATAVDVTDTEVVSCDEIEEEISEL